MKKYTNCYKFILTIIFFSALSIAGVKQSRAQTFSFGKNKVKYHSYNWRYIQSKHFDIYYYRSQNYDLATFAAIDAEASLKELEHLFDYKISQRISIILYSSQGAFEQNNAVPLPIHAQGIGGVTGAYKNRVVVPFSGDYREFRSTLQHELSHAVNNELWYGGNVQSRLSGNAIQIPSWFREGMAEFQSKGFDTETSMYIRDAVINNYLPKDLDQVRGFFKYRVGESFWNFIANVYGRSKITEIYQKMKKYRNVNAAFKSALGLSIKQITKRWRKYYKKRYSPEVANREDISEFANRLTKSGKTGRFNTSPAFSPSGDKIALITNHGNSLNVVVINATTGKKLKTLVKSAGNTHFHQLTLLTPNLTWSPNGKKLALSATAKGQDQLAIVDYKTGQTHYIRFPKLDGIGSVAWAPDGKKICFTGHVGSFQDLFLYNIKTHKLKNLTNDVFTDREPAWGPHSKKIYFASDRGNNLQLGQVKDNVDLLATNAMYSTDIYVLTLGNNRLQRLTKTPKWDETEPKTTRNGRLVFISDKNGIPNVYEMNLSDRTTTPLTNLQTGANQISISSDGSRLAVSTIDKKGRDIYTISAPFSRAKNHPLTDNHWAKRRDSEKLSQLVPAIGYAKQIARSKKFLGMVHSNSSKSAPSSRIDSLLNTSANKADTTGKATAASHTTPADTTKPDTTKKQNPNNINFRHYVFSKKVTQDTSFTSKYLHKNVFKVSNNTTPDDRYIPKKYRLKFSPDLVYASGGINSYYGTSGLTEIRFSDLLGNYEFAFGSNLQFDLRNSRYAFIFADLKNRVNWIYHISHTAYSYGTYGNSALRYRYFNGGVTAQYPLNEYSRVEFTLAGVNIAQDYTVLGAYATSNHSISFAYPQLVFTKDKSVPGLITPVGGFRYALKLSGSPPITGKTLQFVSVLGDFRKYFNLGHRYSFAVRGTAGASFGRDSQTYFLGGERGWLNRKFSNATIPRGRFGRSFIAQPALPLRGYDYFALNGNKFGLANAEFRFPLFAALLPGPIPILPLYNLTGVAFVDAGMAWGQAINYSTAGAFSGGNGSNAYYTNKASLDFQIRKNDKVNVNGQKLPAPKGDILIGAGFGLRTIVFGLPLRWDIAWPYYRNGFGSHPVNYISIGVDF